MPLFDPITPVRKGGKTYTDTPVELDADTGAELVALLAVAPSVKQPAAVAVAPPAPPAPPPPAPTPPAPPPAEKPLAKMIKVELLAIAKAEGVTIADDATNKTLIAAIEAKRTSAA